MNGHSQASYGSLGQSGKRKRASTRWGPDPDEADLTIPVGENGQDGDAQAGPGSEDPSQTAVDGASKSAGQAKRKPKRSRWGPDEEDSKPAAPAPDHASQPAVRLY